MPIGKNAIKRVENNGYSNVASSAPDMENSIVAETRAFRTESRARRSCGNVARSENDIRRACKAQKGPSRKGKARQGGDGGRFSDSRRAETENRKGR